MGHFTSLRESTSAQAKEIHTIISIHPAFPYIRTSHLYDALYVRFREQADNLSEARIRVTIHVCHILDEIAHSLGIISSDVHYSIPEHLFQDAFSNPKYKAYSPLVTPESRKRQEQRIRKAAKNSALPKTNIVSAEHLEAATSNSMHSLMNAFVTPKRKG